MLLIFNVSSFFQELFNISVMTFLGFLGVYSA